MQARVVPGGATANTRGALNATAEKRTFAYQQAPSAVFAARPTLSWSDLASTETSPRVVAALFNHVSAGASSFNRVTPSVTMPSETITPNTASRAVSMSAWDILSFDCTRCPPSDATPVSDNALTKNSTNAASRMVNALDLIGCTVRRALTASGRYDGDLNTHELTGKLTVEPASANRSRHQVRRCFRGCLAIFDHDVGHLGWS